MFREWAVVRRTIGGVSLAVIHLDELLPDAACGVNQLVQPLELQGLVLLVVRVLTRLQDIVKYSTG